MISDAQPVPSPRYLLLNPRHRDPQQLQHDQDVTADKGLYVIHQPHLEQPAHWALRLVDLQQRPDIRAAAQQWSMDPRWPRETFCGWLTAEVSPLEMVAHLERQLVQQTPDNRRMLLRYFDPRVLDQLEHILDEHQRAALLGPITHWTFLDIHRHERTLQCSALHHRFNLINESQWQAIGYTSEVEHIRQAWLDYIAPAQLPNDHYSLIMAWLALADQHELQDSTDRLTFVLIGVQLRWRFDLTPGFRQLMARQHTEERSLTALLKMMPSDEWAHIEQWTRQEPYPV